MCTLLFAFEAHPAHRLVVAANRDERYERPTRALHAWEDRPGVIAGRDLAAGGTWMGLGVGGLMGVDMEVMPQFTLGTGIGASLTFADKFDTINFGLLTASIRAGFWW